MFNKKKGMLIQQRIDTIEDIVNNRPTNFVTRKQDQARIFITLNHPEPLGRMSQIYAFQLDLTPLASILLYKNIV